MIFGMAYDTDLTDTQWSLLSGYFEHRNGGGRPFKRLAQKYIKCLFLRSENRLSVATSSQGFPAMADRSRPFQSLEEEWNLAHYPA